jgi:hypothetical protein
MDIALKTLLQTAKYGLTPELAEISAPYLRNAKIAQYAGDEWISPEEAKNLEELAKTVPADLIDEINNYWTDLPSNDNKIHIKLK